MKIDKFILGILGLMPIIETLNGMYSGNHISDLYRILLLILIVCRIMISSYVYLQSIEMISIILFFFLLTCMQFIFLHGQIEAFISDMKTISRIMLAPLYYGYFCICLNKNTLEKRHLQNLLCLYSFLYGTLIIVPYLFGQGFATYDVSGTSFFSSVDEGVGVKGFFIEVNSLSAILISCLLFSGEKIFDKLRMVKIKSSLFYFCIFVINNVALLLVAMKTGVAIVFLYLVIFIIRLLTDKKITFELRRKIMLFIILSMLFSYSCFNTVLLNSIIGAFNRGKYFYNQFGGDVLTFVTSSRSSFLSNTFEAIQDSPYSLFLFLFGGGYWINLAKFYDPFKRVVTEMDWWDFFFSYGISGIAIYLLYFWKGLRNSIILKNRPIKIMLGSLFLYSIFAGHVIFNSMTATFLAICLGYATCNEQNELDRKEDYIDTSNF
ncbi:beta-carotene 15,15'-monooxygenase [Enterococcus lactis]|uniref:beta-carotene 15,15'-monooxygenase n=1 Tax=Enterococcus lactis TaxID=357441 RepID=UPI004041392F